MLWPAACLGCNFVCPSLGAITAQPLHPWPYISQSGFEHLPCAAGPRGLSLVAAAGPFTTAEDLAYGPLKALLQHCQQQQPDVLLLMGPFVDADHPKIQDGQLQQTFSELFWSQVSLSW